jgi:hypothetical protein
MTLTKTLLVVCIHYDLEQHHMRVYMMYTREACVFALQLQAYFLYRSII